MQFVFPDDYDSFSCLMGDCKHTCCQGWEIDIDEASLAFYRSRTGETREWLKSGMEETPDGARFHLAEGEKCAFLRPDGLCEMILRLGKDSLCQVCRDHPRFRNFFSHRVETGLGLCCEAAGKMILTRKKPMAFRTETDGKETEEPTEEEAYLLSLRERIILGLQCRRFPLLARLEKMLSENGLNPCLPGFKETAAFFLTLERLSDDWTRLLKALAAAPEVSFSMDPRWEIPLEQFAVYHLFRHLPGALEDGDLDGRIQWTALSCRLIAGLCNVHAGPLAEEDFIEICRLYSSEIEYSDENESAILDWLWEKR